MLIRNVRGSRRWFVAAGAAVLLTGMPVGAQAPAQPPPAQPPANPSEQEYTLVYKYAPGTVQHFKTGAKAEIAATPQGGGAGIPPVGVSVNTVGTYSEKITGDKEGTGSITTQYQTLIITSEIPLIGSKAVTKLVNGKVTTTVNGKPGASPVGGDPTALQTLARPITSTKTKRGVISVTDAKAAQSQDVIFGGGSVSVLVLPEKPIRVGDSWETTQVIKPSVPVPQAGINGTISQLEIKFTHTLKNVETKNGKTFAIIESTGSGSTPPGAPGMALNQSYTGTSRFDVNRGVIVSGMYNIDVSATISLQGVPAPQGANAPQGMKLDGTITANVLEVPAAAAAPARKGAARRPARKR